MVYRRLLEDAFTAQRVNRRIGTYPEYRIAGFEEINGSVFRYEGELPLGIREFVRQQTFILSQNDPRLVFDEPLDMDLMEESVKEVFGKKARIERETDDRTSLRGSYFGFLPSDKYILRFWRRTIDVQSGVLEYYTDNSANEFASQTPKVVEVVARYLVKHIIKVEKARQETLEKEAQKEFGSTSQKGS